MSLRIGSKVIITNIDNDTYEKYFDKQLTVTHASNKDNRYYDSACYPDKLCELKVTETNEHLPFALYEWELKRI